MPMSLRRPARKTDRRASFPVLHWANAGPIRHEPFFFYGPSYSGRRLVWLSSSLSRVRRRETIRRPGAMGTSMPIPNS